MRNRVLALLVLLIAAGCGTKPEILEQNAQSRPTPLPEAKEFTWGSGTISLGMRKADVLEQITRTWERPADDVFASQGMKVPGVKMPSAEQQKNDRWDLSYGEGSGAAPGGGGITFVFENGILIKIIIGPAFA